MFTGGSTRFYSWNIHAYHQSIHINQKQWLICFVLNVCLLFLIFIKNVVAVAAYSQPADPMRNFRQWNWVPFLLCAQLHLRRALNPPVVTSIFTSLVCAIQSEHALAQWPSQANSSIETKIVCGCRNARQSLSSVDVCWSRFWSRNRVYFVSVSSRACVDKMAEPKSRDRSPSTES